MISSKQTVTKLNVKKVCGAHTLSRADGKVLHDVLIEHWPDSTMIEIDFDNLPVASASFLDEAIGRLVLQFKRREISEKLRLVRMSQFDRNLLNDIAAARLKQMRREKHAGKT